MNQLTAPPIYISGVGPLSDTVSQRLHLIRSTFAKAKSAKEKQECAAKLKRSLHSPRQPAPNTQKA